MGNIKQGLTAEHSFMRLRVTFMRCLAVYKQIVTFFTAETVDCKTYCGLTYKKSYLWLKLPQIWQL